MKELSIVNRARLRNLEKTNRKKNSFRFEERNIVFTDFYEKIEQIWTEFAIDNHIQIQSWKENNESKIIQGKQCGPFPVCDKEGGKIVGNLYIEYPQN